MSIAIIVFIISFVLAFGMAYWLSDGFTMPK
jgi:ABC-type spermidine/putrescine transport system permease subunit I